MNLSAPSLGGTDPEEGLGRVLARVLACRGMAYPQY